MSLKLGRSESVISLLCLGIAEKRRKRKRPAARGAGPASKLFTRHPREHSCQCATGSGWAMIFANPRCEKVANGHTLFRSQQPERKPAQIEEIANHADENE